MTLCGANVPANECSPVCLAINARTGAMDLRTTFERSVALARLICRGRHLSGSTAAPRPEGYHWIHASNDFVVFRLVQPLSNPSTTMTALVADKEGDLDRATLVLRLVLATVFLVHGYQKVFVYGFAGVTSSFTHMGVPMPGLFAPLICVLELGGGVAMLLGAFHSSRGRPPRLRHAGCDNIRPREGWIFRLEGWRRARARQPGHGGRDRTSGRGRVFGGRPDGAPTRTRSMKRPRAPSLRGKT